MRIDQTRNDQAVLRIQFDVGMSAVVGLDGGNAAVLDHQIGLMMQARRGAAGPDGTAAYNRGLRPACLCCCIHEVPSVLGFKDSDQGSRRMFASLTTLAQRARSAATCVPNCSGVPPTGTTPSPTKR